MHDDPRFVRVIVSGLVRDQRANPVVLLREEHGADVLPIWIGPAEGAAIELTIRGQAFERPLTHDLLKTTLESLGASVTRVAVTELRESTYFARIYLRRDDEVFVIDARPSDSIALALKTRAPIYVAREVFEAHRRTIESSPGRELPDDETIRRYLEDLDPGEF